jgi:glutamate mutase epsilon subunit
MERAYVVAFKGVSLDVPFVSARAVLSDMLPRSAGDFNFRSVGIDQFMRTK